MRFDLRNGYLIVVQCSVGRLQGLSGILDTGTSDTVLDDRVVSRLSLPTSAAAALMVDREAEVRNVTAPAIRIGSVESTPKSAIAADLSRMAEQMGVRIDLIIGMDVLRNSDFEIDYNARRVRFGTIAPMAHSAAMSNVGGLSTVELTGLSAAVHVLLDTGFSDLLLFRTRAGRTLNARDAEVRLATNAAPAKLQALQPDTIGIGDWHARHRTLLIANPEPAHEAPFDGLLGPRFLNASRVAFEFRRGVFSWN